MPNLDSTTLLIAVTVIFLLITGGLLIVVVRQKSQLKELKHPEQPKTGFMGKQIIPLFIAAMMIGGFGITYSVSNRTQTIPVSSEQEVSVSILTNHSSLNSGESAVEFSVVPYLDGIAWGGDTAGVYAFDVFWTVKGPKVFSQIELTLDSENNGGFTRTLPKGEYEVKVEMVFNGVTFKESKSVEI